MNRTPNIHQRMYLGAILRNGGLPVKHPKILQTRRADLHAFADLLAAKLIKMEHGRIYATAKGCVAFGPEIA